MNTVTSQRPTTKQRLHSANHSAPATDDGAAQHLSAIVMRSKTREALYAALVTFLSQQPKFAAAGFFVSTEAASEFGPHTFDGPAFDTPGFLKSLADCAKQAQLSGRQQTARAEKIRNVAIVAAPLTSPTLHSPLLSSAPDVLTVAIVTEPNESPDISLLQLVASYVGVWHANQRHSELQQQLSVTAATLDLLSKIDTAETFRNGCINLVNAVKDHLQCRAFILALTGQIRSQHCRVAAMSGLAEVDSNSTMARSIEDALNECVGRNRLSEFPENDSADRVALLAHQKMRGELQAERLISHPLIASDGTVIGAWLAVYDTQPVSNEPTVLLRVAAPRVADALKLAKHADASFLTRRAKSGTRRKWLKRFAVAATVTTALLMIPVPYRVHCDCSAEPDVRRFIVAPHEGLIEKTYVQPGDVVTRGQLLATMDGRDVRWELAGLAAEREKASKEHDAGLLRGDAAAAQRASLELQRVSAREQILTRRKDQLELKAPVDGIVLDGHLDRVENAPVTIGQALYEVAPLSPVTVEVALPADEFANVRTGFPVVVAFDGIDITFDGTINRIHPRSEVQNSDNVFIAEVELNNTHEQLRPGMKGHAKVKGESHSLGWNLFHKPWEHLRQAMPF